MFSNSVFPQRRGFFLMYEADSALPREHVSSLFEIDEFASALHANGKWVSTVRCVTKRQPRRFLWLMRSLHEKGLVRSAWIDCRVGEVELDIPDGLFETVRARKVLMRQMV